VQYNQENVRDPRPPRGSTVVQLGALEAVARANPMTLASLRRSFLAARRFSLLIVTVALIGVTLFVGYIAIYIPT
jgi:hypothetical protein